MVGDQNVEFSPHLLPSLTKKSPKNTQRPKKDPVVPLERNLHGHPSARLLWERQFEKVLLEHGWEKFQIGNAYSLTEKKDYSCLFMWTISKLAGKKQNVNPTWKILMKDVDLGEPTSFLDQVYLGCTQRKCQISKHIVDNYRNMFESRISAGEKEKLPVSRKSDANISSWSYGMEGHAKKCVERYFELANNATVTQSRNTMP